MQKRVVGCNSKFDMLAAGGWENEQLLTTPVKERSTTMKVVRFSKPIGP